MRNPIRSLATVLRFAAVARLSATLLAILGLAVSQAALAQGFARVQSQAVRPAAVGHNLRPCPQNESNGSWTNCYGTVGMGNGERYEGDMKAGLFDGRGTYTYASGATYVGEWKTGGRHGQGVLVAAKGDKYDPNVEYNRPWSRNTPFSMLVNMGEGDRYEGEWRDNRRHGQGVYRRANGDVYIGEFKEDRFEGQGKVTFANGAKPMSGT